MHAQMNEHTPPGTRRNEIATAAEAVRLIHDGDTVATGGFVGIARAPRPRPRPPLRLLSKPLSARYQLDLAHRMLFIDFEGLTIDSRQAVAAIEDYVTRLLAPVVTKPEDRLTVVVTHENFCILPGIVDEYSEMVARLTERFYGRVTRYGTGGFLKARVEGRAAS